MIPETGLVFDIRRFCVHDGPGIRTTVFFKGCPLSCWWCHNPESRDPSPETSVKHLSLGGKAFDRAEIAGKWMTVDEVMTEVGQDRVFYEESSGGVTFSGGEPMLQEAFLAELLQACRQRGFHTALDTSGYATPEAMAHTASLADLVLFDLKIMNNELHRKYTGVSNRVILENLKYLHQSGKHMILRFPVIPGITDTQENIRDMMAFLGNELAAPLPPLSLLPYHSMAKEKYRRFCKTNQLQHLPDLKAEELLPLKKQFEDMGMKVSIGG
ncbi:MAG: glycyl-radical enzyme activating protein [Bacteroidota bacterium]